MPLLSDYDNFDRQMGKRAQCGIDSRKDPQGFTIEEVCERADYPMPVSEKDLIHFADLCETWGIKTCIDDVGFFAEYRKRARKTMDIEFWKAVAKVNGY